MKSKEEFLDDCYITLQPKERGAILQAMESYAQEKVNKISSNPVLADSLPLSSDSHPDTEADGIVFCGKCGKIK